ncbi:MAG: flagellar basal body-associated FliL family protein [Pseudomonadota bacterium]
MKKLLPLIFALVGLGAGIAGGMVLKPEPAPEEKSAGKEDGKDTDKDASKDTGKEEAAGEKDAGDTSSSAFVKINNQFVVPVVKGERVQALVVLSISLETQQQFTERLYDQEPKLRDAFLRVMFDHAYAGGFGGAFTASPTLDSLRAALLESSRPIVEDAIKSVLITDIVRQDT